MKLHKNSEFTERLMKAKEKLGFHYGVLVRSKNPKFTRQRTLNIVHNGTIDWDFLKTMEELAGITQP
jgi:hypothetical protein